MAAAPKHDAAAHTVDGVAADGALRLIEVDPRQERCTRRERIRRNTDAGADAAADVGAAGINDGDGGRGAHIDDHKRRGILPQRGDRRDDQVTADLRGIVDLDVGPVLMPGPTTMGFPGQLHDRRAGTS